MTYSSRFSKHYKKLEHSEKDLIKKKLLILIKDPRHPSLRTKKIKGSIGLFESRINMDIRLLWYYEGEQILVILDVGHHDLLDRY